MRLRALIARALLPLYLASGIACLPTGCRPVSEPEPVADPTPPPAPTPQPDPRVKVVYPSVPGSFVATARKVRPSVVNIFTAQIVRQSPFSGMPGLGELFGIRQRERIQRSLGSGFLIDAQGYVLTNFHVVRGAHEILVQLEDGRDVPAVPVGAEPGLDVALLHVEETGLTPAVLGDSDQLEVGEWVLAVGNPFGLSHTVTQGIVSAKGRDSRDIGMAEHGYQNFIQTDASINPGNSGGPLVNMEGQVVGMNTAVAAAGQGIGFAVPINMIKAILPQLKRSGRVVPAWIGVGIRELSDGMLRRLKVDRGVLVTEVYQGGPADEAGIEPGDIILSFNGAEVRAVDELAWLTNTAGPGNQVVLSLIKDGERREARVRVVAKPGSY